MAHLLTVEEKERISSLLREMIHDDDLPDGLLLSHWIVVCEFSTSDADYVLDISDGITTASHRIGLLRMATHRILGDDEEDE